MFNKKLEEKIESLEKKLERLERCEERIKSIIRLIDNQTDRNFDKVVERLREVEKKLVPEPRFKEGDIVNFLLIDIVIEGEIIKEYLYDYNADSKKWVIGYLDNNKVVQEVIIPEKDIITFEESQLEEALERIEDLEFRLRELNKKK